MKYPKCVLIIKNINILIHKFLSIKYFNNLCNNLSLDLKNLLFFPDNKEEV
jgi:hypothetical protein